MNNLLNVLPQTIKNLIGEFNADHRYQLYYVLQELIEKEYTCWFCDDVILNNRKVRYIMFKKLYFVVVQILGVVLMVKTLYAKINYIYNSL